jgi:uncharacterized protein (TIGR02246 family)
MDEEDELRQLLKTFAGALNDGDAAGLVSCYMSDGVAMGQMMPTAAGPNLPAIYRQFFKDMKLSVSFTVDEVVVASDTVAYALTRSQGTLETLATGDSDPEDNREIFIFGREDEAWKIKLYMFNTPR